MWRMAVSYPEVERGTVVYKYNGFDFGQAFTKHRMTGRDTLSVTTDPDGHGPFFVAFKDDLEEVE